MTEYLVEYDILLLLSFAAIGYYLWTLRERNRK